MSNSFVLGRGDHVLCFYCDGGLKGWEPQDDPFEEHAKWFGDCAFVQLVKGPQYVFEVKRRFGLIESTSNDEPEEWQNTQSISQPSEPAGQYHSEELKKSISTPAKNISEPIPAIDQDELLRQNEHLKNERLCKVCLDNEMSIVFIPCGHFVTCVNCAPSLSLCPICRRKIDKAVRTFMS